MKNKNIKFIFGFLLPFMIYGQFNDNYNGAGLDIGSNGSGVFITKSSLHSSGKISLNGELRFYDIKAKDETVVYDYYSGQYKDVGGISLVMFPFLMGSNYYPFSGKIENNFSPFITARGGMVLTLDGDESGTFYERWRKASTQVSPGGFIVLGIDFKMVGQTTVSTMVGLELIKLKKMADNNKDYSGFLIHIAFNRRSK